MTKQEIDYLLELYDDTHPAIQRGIVVRFVELYAAENARVQELETALQEIATHGDDDHPCEHESITWCRHHIERVARAAIIKATQPKE